MLNDADKQKLRDCWQRVTQGPAAGHVFAAGKGMNGADITVGSIYQHRLDRQFDRACDVIEAVIQDGGYASVDEYIAQCDWVHSDIANITKPMDQLRQEWQQRKLQP